MKPKKKGRKDPTEEIYIYTYRGRIGYITYKTVDIHPVRVGLSTGCALYFKRIEIGGVGGVEGEEVGYAIWRFSCVLEGGALERRNKQDRREGTL